MYGLALGCGASGVITSRKNCWREKGTERRLGKGNFFSPYGSCKELRHRQFERNDRPGEEILSLPARVHAELPGGRWEVSACPLETGLY